ncbi:MAG: hypothetical protein LWW91_09890, partial [Bacteroidales bacterium]|nr:hypothetical protein [Bacteroidales bacterium]
GNEHQQLLPGGFKKDGEPVTSLEGITALLSDWFDSGRTPVELLRYERLSSRKTLVRLCEVTMWRKKSEQ